MKLFFSIELSEKVYDESLNTKINSVDSAYKNKYPATEDSNYYFELIKKDINQYDLMKQDVKEIFLTESDKKKLDQLNESNPNLVKRLKQKAQDYVKNNIKKLQEYEENMQDRLSNLCSLLEKTKKDISQEELIKKIASISSYSLSEIKTIKEDKGEISYELSKFLSTK
ncbi:hypothetical protein AB837_00560 [bacterium AB1]|nr:hypothetical protein AB837_00560 [bacterium AB1]